MSLDIDSLCRHESLVNDIIVSSMEEEEEKRTERRRTALSASLPIGSNLVLVSVSSSPTRLLPMRPTIELVAVVIVGGSTTTAEKEEEENE